MFAIMLVAVDEDGYVIHEIDRVLLNADPPTSAVIWNAVLATANDS